MCKRERGFRGVSPEVDDAQHFTPKGKRRDKIRDADLRSDGLEVLRFKNAEVLTNSDGLVLVVFEKVEAALKGNAA